MSTIHAFPNIEAARGALAADGYDTHETATGTVYIAGLAPDSAEYDGCTDPGSPWDEECDWRLEAILDIVSEHGCSAQWSDDDMVIEAMDDYAHGIEED